MGPDQRGSQLSDWANRHSGILVGQPPGASPCGQRNSPPSGLRGGRGPRAGWPGWTHRTAAPQMGKRWGAWQRGRGLQRQELLCCTPPFRLPIPSQKAHDEISTTVFAPTLGAWDRSAMFSTASIRSLGLSLPTLQLAAIPKGAQAGGACLGWSFSIAGRTNQQPRGAARRRYKRGVWPHSQLRGSIMTTYGRGPAALATAGPQQSPLLIGSAPAGECPQPKALRGVAEHVVVNRVGTAPQIQIVMLQIIQPWEEGPGSRVRCG